MNKRIVSLLSVTIATVLVVAACGSSGNGGPDDSLTFSSAKTMALVPDGSTVVISISMTDALADPTIQQLFTDLTQPDLPGILESGKISLTDTVSLFQTASGIDLDLVEEIVVFFKPDGTESDSRSGFGLSGDGGAAIFRGDIDSAAVIAAASKGYPIVTSYQGREIRVDEADEDALAILDDHYVVTGSGASVRQVIDVVGGDASSLSGSVAKAYDSLPNSGLLNGVLSFQKAPIDDALGETGDALGSFGGFRPDLTVFSSIKIVGFTLGTEEEVLLSTIALTHPTAELAGETLTALNSFVNIIRGFLATPELLTFLDSVDVEAMDNQVVITIRVDPLTLPELQESFEGLSDGF